MAKRKRRSGFKIPVVSLAILAGQAFAANAQGGDWLNKLAAFGSFYSGVTLQGNQIGFTPDRLLVGWTPWIVKGFASKVAHGMGASPRVPFGLPISVS